MPLSHWLRSFTRASSGARRFGRLHARPRPWAEPLEDRLAPAVVLSYGGPGTVLSLAETATAGQHLTLSEPTAGLLRVDLNGATFDPTSTGAATGLAYENAGKPGTSTFATVDISQAGNVSTLMVALSTAGDVLDLGMANAASGVGAVDVNASGGGTDIVNLNDLALGGAGTAGTLSVTADALTVTTGSTVHATGTITLTSTGTLSVGAGATVTSTDLGASAVALSGAILDVQGTVRAPGSGLLGATGTFQPFASGFGRPIGLAFDAAGNLYVANRNGTVSKVTPAGAVSTFATLPSGADGLAFDAAGNLYVSGGNTVSKVTPAGAVSTFATGLSDPGFLAFDAAGNLYATNTAFDTVSKVTPAGAVSTFATGMNEPTGLAFDAAGNLYVANYAGDTVSKVTPAGAVSTFASGTPTPTGLAFDAAGTLYVANYGNGNAVRKVTPAGAVSIFASGLSGPEGLAFDAAGNLYVSNFDNGTVSVTSSAVEGGGVTVDTAGTAGTPASPLHVVAGALSAHAQGGMTLATQVSNLTADGGAGSVSVTNTGDLTLAAVGTGVSVTNTGNLTLAADGGAGGVSVTNTGDLTLAAVGTLTGVSATTDVTISTTGNLSANAPVHSTNGAVTLSGNGILRINAALTGRSATVNGGTGPDTIAVTTTGATPLTINGNGGNDTIGVAALTGALGEALGGTLTLNFGNGANVLQVAETANTVGDTVVMTSTQLLGQGAHPFTINYTIDVQATGGFAGASLVTGSDAQHSDVVSVEGTAGKTGIVTGAGNDTVGVSAVHGALGDVLLGGLFLLIDQRGGANTMQVAEANDTVGDTVTLSTGSYLVRGKIIHYQATGGTFAGVSLVTGSGNDTITVNGVTGPAGVVSGAGTDTINVNVRPDSGYNLGVVGGASVAQGAQDTLNLVASPGTAVVHQSVSGPDTGTFTVLFAGGGGSGIAYFDVGHLFTMPPVTP